MTTGSYYTLQNEATGLLKEKGSKFLSFAYPVNSEVHIKEKLSDLKKEHPSASHHCYAWRLGADKVLYRSNDDGEPSNSAGKPIFSVIQSRNLSNVLIVVVRYFGGTLLGVNGLINAYKDAALAAIENATIYEQFVMENYSVAFDMNDMNLVMRILKEYEAKILSNSYSEKNILTFQVKVLHAETLEAKFRDFYTVKLSRLPI